MSEAFLALIVFAAFGTEAAMGFGCNVLAVTMAVHLFPLELLLPVLVSLNLVVSTYIVLRHRDGIDLRLLLTRILPLMLVGMPMGMLLFNQGSSSHLKLGFGVFVVLVAGVELVRLRRNPLQEAPPLPLWKAALVLALGGLMHGLYASGGPMAVYYSSRALPDKHRFRSTLSLLWLLLNAVLMAGYLWRDVMGRRTVELAGLMVLPLTAGIAGGEWLHSRVNPTTFRLLVFLLLLAGGGVLVLSTVR